MAPLQPLQQTTFEQGPQVGSVPTEVPTFMYQEGQVILPEPINPAVALDPGVNWYGLGAETMKIAQDMVTETWDYLIDTKKNALADLSFQKKNQLNDLYSKMADLETQIRENPLREVKVDREQFTKDIKGVEESWQKGAQDILGKEDYLRWTGDKIDFSGLGRKWQGVALATRESQLAVSNQARKIITDLAILDAGNKENRFNFLTETHKNAIRSANNDVDGAVNAINEEFNLVLETLQANPNAPLDLNATVKQYGEQLGTVRKQWEERVITAIGQENYDRMTDPNIDYSLLQKHEQALALALRESKTGVEKQMTATMLGFSRIATRQNKSEEVVQGFLSNRRMTNEEMRKSIPVQPHLRGTSMLPANPNGTMPSVFNQPGTNKPIVDNAGNPLYIQVPGTEGKPQYVLNVYPNSANVGMGQFNINELPDEVLDTLAIMDKPNTVSPDGTNIHPDVLQWAAAALQGGNDKEIARVLAYLKHIPSNQMLPRILSGREGMNLEEASRITMAFAFAKSGVPYTAAAEALRKGAINSSAVFGILDSLSLASSTSRISYEGAGRGEAGAVAMAEDTMVGLQATVETLHQLLGMPIEEGFFWTTTTTKEGALAFDDIAGGSSAITWIQNNPNVKFLVARAIAGAQTIIATQEAADPKAFKNGEEKLAAFKDAVKNIVTEDAIGIGLVAGPNGVVALSRGAKVVERIMVDSRKSGMSAAGLTLEQQKEREADTKQERWKQITATNFRFNTFSGIKKEDNEATVRAKSLEFMRRFGGGRVDMEVAEHLLNTIVEVDTAPNQSGEQVSKNLSDGLLLQIAVASIPSVWSNYGYAGVQGTPYNVSASSVSLKDRAEYGGRAFAALGPAWGWGLEFSTTNIDAIESDNGGFPVAINSIQDRYGKELLPSVANRLTQTVNGYLPTHGDDTPLLMVGSNMDEEAANNLAKGYGQQLKDYTESKAAGKPTFKTTGQLRTPLSPGREVSTNIDVTLKAAETYSPQETDWGYRLPAEARDMPIRNITDLEAVFADNVETLIQIGKEHPVLSQRSAAGNPITNFANQLESEVGLFSEPNVRTILDWAKKQTKKDGTPKYKTAGDYLSLFTQLAVIGTDNNALNKSYKNYNRKAAEEDAAIEPTQSTRYDEFTQGYKIKPLVTQGKNKGLILWNEQDSMFKDVALDLVNNGFDLVRDKQTSQVFARLPNEPVDLERMDVLFSRTRPITQDLPALESRQIERQLMETIAPAFVPPPPVTEEKPDTRTIGFRGGSGKPAPPKVDPFKTAWNWLMGNKEEPVKPKPQWDTNPYSPTVPEQQTQQSATISPGAVSEPPPYLPIIRRFEKLETKAYWDEYGKVWTIGRGNTRYLDGTPVKEGDTITQEQAEELAIRWADEKVIPSLEKKIPTWAEMNKNQKAAIISFAYNVGENFYGLKGYETITKALSKVENFKDVPAALALYKKSKGVVLAGLVTRRKLEAELFVKEPD